MLSFTGIERSTIFQLHNDGLSTLYDSAGVNKFNTTGLTDGHYVADDYSPGTNATSWYAYPAYYFQKTIWISLYNYKPDSIIYDNHDSIYVYRYVNANDADSVAYAIWSGTQTNRSTTNYAIKTGHPSASARIIHLADKAFYGDTTNVTSGADSTIVLTIGETPQLLFTTEGTDGGTLIDTVTSDTPPTAHAGSDQTIRLPVNSATLAGSGTDGSGSIISHVWSFVSGSATITDPDSYTSTVTGLSEGTYVLQLKVTDENGLSDSDDMTITVNAAYVGPTLSAGLDQTIRLPTNSVTLDGSATAGDGTISNHTWSKVSGSGGTITDPSSYTSTFTGLTAGTYVLKLKVTDSNGLSDSDNVTVTVNAAYVGPTAYAGTDQTLDPGTTSTTLAGSAVAGDGTISAYAWTKVSGATCTISSPSSASTSVTGLANGNTYLFRLTVTDSNDLTGTDDVSVTVSSTPPPTGTLQFRWFRKIGSAYYLIYQNTETGNFYYWKIL